MKKINALLITLFLFLLVHSALGSDVVLRVGTTGDYPPMTYYNPETSQYSGFDIEMAESLGAYLRLKVEFVRTTWVNLTKDLEDKKFDIAMGGITQTPQRAELFLLSVSVMESGKVPLVRKEDKSKYATLSDIDNKDVTVVENLGGTNLIFARKILKNARIVTVEQNEDAFKYLLDKKADVMFTDNIEALYRQGINANLCALWTDNPMDNGYKIYMLNKDNHSLLKKVNTWLATMKKEGKVSELFQQAIKEKY